jgi:hypothetical protein
MMTPEDSSYCLMHAQAAYANLGTAGLEMSRPFILLRPKMFPDGNQWCALYGEDLQSGVCGFGDTPEKAAQDFDKNWKWQKLGHFVRKESK